MEDAETHTAAAAQENQLSKQHEHADNPILLAPLRNAEADMMQQEDLPDCQA